MNTGLTIRSVILFGIYKSLKSLSTKFDTFQKNNDTKNSQNILNSDIKHIISWGNQWKIQFNSYPKEEANEDIFSRKSNTHAYPPITFNSNFITTYPYQKHLDFVLDSKLDFIIHIEQKIKKYNKMMRLIRRKGSKLKCFNGSLYYNNWCYTRTI